MALVGVWDNFIAGRRKQHPPDIRVHIPVERADVAVSHQNVHVAWMGSGRTSGIADSTLPGIRINLKHGKWADGVGQRPGPVALTRTVSIRVIRASKVRR